MSIEEALEIEGTRCCSVPSYFRQPDVTIRSSAQPVAPIPSQPVPRSVSAASANSETAALAARLQWAEHQYQQVLGA